MGDINANILETDNKTEQYLGVLYGYGFICGIDAPTRVVGNSLTCNDHIFIKHHDYNALSNVVVRTEITDH